MEILPRHFFEVSSQISFDVLKVLQSHLLAETDWIFSSQVRVVNKVVSKIIKPWNILIIDSRFIKNLHFCSVIEFFHFLYTFRQSSVFSLLRNIPTPFHGILIILDRGCFSVSQFQKINKEKKIVKFNFKMIFSVKFLLTASVKMSIVLTPGLSLHNLQKCTPKLLGITGNHQRGRTTWTNEIHSSKINFSRFNKSVFVLHWRHFNRQWEYV